MSNDAPVPAPNALPTLTIFCFAALGLFQLARLARWYFGMPHPVPWDILPSGFWLYAWTTLLMFGIPNAASVFLLSSRFKAKRSVQVVTITLLILLDLATWTTFALTIATGIRVVITIWLLLMLYVVVSNFSFKPRPLRGSA